MSRARKPAREDLDSFETAYNTACASLARGDLKQGEILLKRAKGMRRINWQHPVFNVTN